MQSSRRDYTCSPSYVVSASTSSGCTRIDAARPSEDADCSTNGAVDSDGACHSARVKLFENLPIREKVDVMDIDIKSVASTDLCTPRKRKRGEGS
jgi:hypothetical protein